MTFSPDHQHLAHLARLDAAKLRAQTLHDQALQDYFTAATRATGRLADRAARALHLTLSARSPQAEA